MSVLRAGTPMGDAYLPDPCAYCNSAVIDVAVYWMGLTTTDHQAVEVLFHWNCLLKWSAILSADATHAKLVQRGLVGADFEEQPE